MRILGISAFYHDSAAALLVDGKIVAAAQEERFTRRKHDPNFPAAAIRYCLSAADVSASELDHVVFYEKPFLKFERLLETYLAFAPRGFQSFRKAIPVWLKEKLFQKRLLRDHLLEIDGSVDWEAKLLFADHHQSHAASAFFASPFAESAILTLDGVGEWTTTSAGYGRDNTLDLTREINFPHSVGLLYSAFTYYTGFRVNSGEYKVMGLAPYGEPKYTKLILDHLVDLKEDGSFRLDLQYFDYCTGLTMTNRRFDRLFGGKPREPSERLDQRHMDLAASVQQVTEEIVLRLTRSLAREGQSENLCLAGGVALNCVANGKILRERTFKNIWVQPAAGDAGGAVGAALAAYYQFAGKPRVAPAGDAMAGGYLGPSFAQAEIEQRLAQAGAVFTALTDDALIESTVKALVAEKAVGWFQGRMEFGPRALGARSILGDPRSPRMQSSLNLRVKFRESFRPFAPAVLREDVAEWFELDGDSPYMQIVADVLKKHRRPANPGDEKLFGIERLNIPRSDIPAVTHVDYSARIQTVHADTNARFHALLTAFKAETGCPVLVNTSFNVRGEPIVCTPEDAFRCFMGSNIEVLAVGNCFLLKEDQPTSLKLDYKNAFELD
ncbi:carbamoyltransferase [Bradyrhizobium sp. JYMT SZCCT0428]|uniref:carbamoyltransferase family protein n=1 Tax=Bradyrhizobium sp. JYMT SZCCT0428 TaxID=2807673 RepID=UPI001BA56EA5|nr:carbamoyltransferase [Bradyrhizobium sp. JYMT SZCCT0428]MBR1154688.1 carbamoyltransferase [Bradyrhizobium sp. JYMT SZCCT0428]